MDDTFTRIAVSAPINADAARAVSMRGEADLALRINPDAKHWESRPLTVPPPTNAPDYTGTRLGRMLIVGYLGSAGNDRGARWLARCVCGRYEVRSPKSIKRASQNDQCRRCGHLHYVRRRAYFDAHGRWPPDD